ncbi:MAG: hypothetical protein HY268_20275 [Deltaproteobacteria bacterium]|nr:hypothetical protein [Deltaproteobacteria bacterium]
MKPSDIESWTLDIIARVRAGQPIEDTRVELKAEWPEASKAARRLAGHANAARGEPILWLIGVDEKKGVVGAARRDLASWLPQVCAEFDQLPPPLIDVNVPTGDTTVVALYVETERAPFVVRNPVFGQQGGGSVEREVPWRDGTKIRSVRREDLLRLLGPLRRMPKVEVLGGSVEARGSKYNPVEGGYSKVAGEQSQWQIKIPLYIVPMDTQVLTIPFHRCIAEVSIAGILEEANFTVRRLRPIKWNPTIAVPASVNIVTSESETVIRGPGKVELEAYFKEEHLSSTSHGSGRLKVCLALAEVDRSVVIVGNLLPVKEYVFEMANINVSYSV